MIERPNHKTHPASSAHTRISKRKRDNNAAIEELSCPDREGKKRRVLLHEDPSVSDNAEEPEAEWAMLMRKHLLSLHHGLHTHWTCVCQGCSVLSVRISLPQRKEGSKMDSCFEVFFGVR